MSVPAGDAKALAERILEMKAMNGMDLAAMGDRGRAFCEKHFDLKHCIDHLEKLMTIEPETI